MGQAPTPNGYRYSVNKYLHGLGVHRAAPATPLTQPNSTAPNAADRFCDRCPPSTSSDAPVSDFFANSSP